MGETESGGYSERKFESCNGPERAPVLKFLSWDCGGP